MHLRRRAGRLSFFLTIFLLGERLTRSDRIIACILSGNGSGERAPCRAQDTPRVCDRPYGVRLATYAFI
jgi:hypothetical protein